MSELARYKHIDNATYIVYPDIKRLGRVAKRLTLGFTPHKPSRLPQFILPETAINHAIVLHG